MDKLTPYQQKALNYNSHIALTANAGSGKTFVLSKRFVEIALKENIPLSAIVAITFTEKAAAELYKKISEEIDERLDAENDRNTYNKLERLRRQLVSAKVSTFHSFCADILKELSPDAGIDSNFKTIDQIESNDLIEETIEEYYNEALRSKDSVNNVKYLVRLFGSVRILTEQIKVLFNNRKTVAQLMENFYSKDEDELVKDIRNKFLQMFNKIVISRISEVIRYVNNINSNVISANPGNERAVNIQSLTSSLEKSTDYSENIVLLNEIYNGLFTKDGIRIKGYMPRETRDEFAFEADYLINFFNDLKLFSIIENSDAAERELVNFGKVLTELFTEISKLYESKKHKKSFLDFDDLQLMTQKLIGKEEVRSFLERKYKYIMIDEYQDTNEIQYNIFIPILNYLRDGNLFIVGDEKQSIYMFRGADLDVFNRTKSEILSNESKDSILALPHSFRVSPKIALFTNMLFGILFENPDEQFNEVSYSQLVSVRDDTATGTIELLLNDLEHSEVTEAHLVAKKIISLTNSNGKDKISYSDFAVLARKRNSFKDLEKVFNNFGIPYTIIGGKGFYQKQIIYDLYNYLSFLINPNNSVALIGLLRSPFYSLPDTLIFDISLEKGNNFYDKLTAYGRKNEKVKSILSLLRKHMDISQSCIISILLRTILDDTSYWAVIASKKNAEQEFANLEKLISLSNQFIERGGKSLFDFVDFLAGSMKTLEDEGQANISADSNSVKLMTLHQAKGLEFKAVFLFNTNDYGKSNSVKSKSIEIDKEYGILTKLPNNNNYFESYESAPIIGAYNYKASRKSIAELKRLLYVGVTRAKDYLFITATHKNFSFRKDSFISLIIDGLGINPQQNEHHLSGSQKFMGDAGKNFELYENEVSFDIEINHEYNEQINLRINDDDQVEEDPKFLTDKIESHQKNEIISATKVAIFHQCPMKYNLTYNLGYSSILDRISSKNYNYNFNPNEDDESNRFADIKGSVIHKILEQETDYNSLDDAVNNLLLNYNKKGSLINNAGGELFNSIKKILTVYYHSEIFKEISLYDNSNNEFEIYAKEKDYYLYGIIDKLIIEEDKYIIVDYKTDKITETSLKDKIEHYQTQLMYYAYILNRYVENKLPIEIKIVFLQSLENTFSMNINSLHLSEFGEKISNTISCIRENNFIKNLGHCSKCHFAQSKICVENQD